MRRVATVVALCFVVACVATSTMARPDYTGLLVTNDSGGPVGVYVAGQRLGTAYSGRTCIKLRTVRHGTVTVGFKVLAEGVYYAPLVNLTESDGWEVAIAHNPPTDLMGLRPARRCK